MSPLPQKAKVGRSRIRGDKWRPDGDAKLVTLTGTGMTWKEISEQLPGRSEQSCAGRYKKSLRKRAWHGSVATEVARAYNKYDLPQASRKR